MRYKRAGILYISVSGFLPFSLGCFCIIVCMYVRWQVLGLNDIGYSTMAVQVHRSWNQWDSTILHKLSQTAMVDIRAWFARLNTANILICPEMMPGTRVNVDVRVFS